MLNEKGVKCWRWPQKLVKMSNLVTVKIPLRSQFLVKVSDLRYGQKHDKASTFVTKYLYATNQSQEITLHVNASWYNNSLVSQQVGPVFMISLMIAAKSLIEQYSMRKSTPFSFNIWDLIGYLRPFSAFDPFGDLGRPYGGQVRQKGVKNTKDVWGRFA